MWSRCVLQAAMGSGAEQPDTGQSPLVESVSAGSSG